MENTKEQESRGWDKDYGVDEEIVQFKAYTDKTNFEIVDKDTGKPMCVISGYDLNLDFNGATLKSVEDIEGCLEGVKELFRQLIMENILDNQTKRG